MDGVVGRGTLLAGRYRTLQPIASDLPGATAWEASDQILDRPVRVTILARGDVPQALDAARRAALVTDPRLVRVLDVGEHEGVAYTVTERVTGPSLADLVARAPMPADQARAVIGEAAAALEAARRRGVHHLALRPSVVHLTPDDRVLVTGLSVDGALLGREPGPAAEASRADTVALVALLYAALTGRWPGSVPTVPTRPGDHPPTGSRLPVAPVLQGAPVPPAELSSAVPNDLDTLCAVTLGVHDDGPQTPAELVQELEPWGDIRSTDLFAATQALPVTPQAPTAPTTTVPVAPAGPATVQRTSVRRVFAGGSSAIAARPGTPPPAVPARSATFSGTGVGRGAPPAGEGAAGTSGATGTAALPRVAEAGTAAAPGPGPRPEVAPTAVTATVHDVVTPGVPPDTDASTAPTPADPDATTTLTPPDPDATTTLTPPDPDATTTLTPVRPGETTPAPPTRPARATPQAPATRQTSEARQQGPAQTTRLAATDARPGDPRPAPADARPAAAAHPAATAATAPAATTAIVTERVPAPPAQPSPAAPPARPVPAAPRAPVPAPAAGTRATAPTASPAAPPATPTAAPAATPAATRAPAHAPAAPPPARPSRPSLLPLPGEDELPGARETIAAHRFDPTKLVLLLVAAAMVLGLFAAYRSLTRPVDLTVDGPGTEVTQAPPAEAEEPAAEAPPAEPVPAEPAPAAAPAIASGAQLDPPPGGDENEHPEAVPLAIDGDPSTAWFTRTYNRSDFGGLKPGVGYAVTLAAPATVTTVTLQVQGTGGRVEVRATDPATPTEGDVLAEGTLGPQTVLTLAQPTETQTLVLWFTELPQAGDGANRLELAEVTVS